MTAFHPIEETLRSGKAEGRILVSGSGPRIKAIIALAAKSGISVRTATPAELTRLAPDHRGIVFESTAATSPTEVFLEDFLARPRERALVLILDHIEDPQNYGAIMRSADAFGADLVIAPKRRAAPLSEAAARASAGAAAHVPVASVVNLADALRRLAEAGFWLYAADMDGTPLPSLAFPSRTGIVMGNEGAGVSRLLGEICDETVSIPMWGHVDSLNVSASAAVLMYEFRRQFPL